MTQEPAQPSADSSPTVATLTENQTTGLPAPDNDATAPAVALVQGQPYTQLPQDLYIPPDALEVILETFEGPLDLLLYLIKRQNLDILNIPIADITRQYMEYIGLMESMRFELAAEYLLMAAMLAEIKSRMLLPRVVTEGDDEEDPRAELIRRLQEYEQFKEAAMNLEGLPRVEREIYPSESIQPPELDREIPLPDITLQELLLAFKDVAMRTHATQHHQIDREVLSVRERMTHILSVLQIGDFCEFSTCFVPEEGRLGVVVTFLAILELCKEASIDIVQSAPFAPIYLKAKSGAIESTDNEPATPAGNQEDDIWH